ncbi:unnamed protein product [Oreochromis niloticus]|nr:unnamed protein product [Mustela putorius furo]
MSSSRASLMYDSRYCFFSEVGKERKKKQIQEATTKTVKSYWAAARCERGELVPQKDVCCLWLCVFLLFVQWHLVSKCHTHTHFTGPTPGKDEQLPHQTLVSVESPCHQLFLWLNMTHVATPYTQSKDAYQTY